MKNPVIIAAERIIDGVGEFELIPQYEKILSLKGHVITYLFIDPLHKGWKYQPEKNHFKSGCAPIEALDCACNLITAGKSQAVIIEGTDNLKSRYSGEEQKRRQLMNIYGDYHTLPEAYTKLAYEFIRKVNITPIDFKRASKLLYENFAETIRRSKCYLPPDERWFRYITDLYRGVDCANPSVDFSGKMLIGSKYTADLCEISREERISVKGVGLGETKGDGPEYITEIASYNHLRQAYTSACRKAGINFTELFRKGNALLEVYSCYPVVPLAFLLHSGIASSFSHLEDILKTSQLVVTGGMNIAKAPWNNPALNALIVMHEKLKTEKVPCGAVHGNGGLGYKQGVAILGMQQP